MIPARLDYDFEEVDQTSLGGPSPSLVSAHFILSALRRRWLVCAMSAMLGVLAAAAFLVAFPAAHTAKATLVLAHDPELDSSRAMSTDVSLLRTRIVATRTLDSLGLAMTPDDFLKTVTAEPVSSELLSLTLSAPTSAEAVRRLSALSSTYLDFRGSQLAMQSSVLLDGMQQRIEKLQRQVAALTRRIERQATGNSDNLSEDIAQRAHLQAQIETLQESIEDATLRNATVLSLSRVLDPVAPDAAGMKRRVALTLASGLIGGAALGCGTVLFFAITSDRLRRRSDVAAALEVTVSVSVGRIAPFPKRWLWLPLVRRLNTRRGHERRRLARAIKMGLPVPGRAGRIAVVCVDNANEVGFAVVDAATELVADGCSVVLLDLTEDGRKARPIPGSTDMPTLLRPIGPPALVGPADLHSASGGDEDPLALETAEATLVLADLDPSVGVDYLKIWTDRVIIALTAGRSSAEVVRTAADLVRSAGLDLRFAVLLHTEATDDSVGIAAFDRPTPIRRADQPYQSASTREYLDGKQGAAEGHTAAPGLHMEPAGIEESVTVPDQTPAVKRHPAREEQLTAAKKQAVDDKLVIEDLTIDDKPPAQLKLPSTDQVHDDDDGPTVNMPAISDLEPIATEELAADPAPVVEQATATYREAVEAEARTPSDLERAAANEQTTDELSAESTEGAQEADLEDGAEERGPSVQDDRQTNVGGQPMEEDLSEQKKADEDKHLADCNEIDGFADARKETNGRHVVPHPLADVGSAAGFDDEFDWNLNRTLDGSDSDHDASVTNAHNEVLAEPDKVADHPNANAVNGWFLYVDAYPPAPEDSAAPAQDEKPVWSLSPDHGPEPNPAGAEAETELIGGELSRTADGNGLEQGSVPRPPAQDSAQDRGRPNGQVSNGQRRQLTRSRSRRRRSRLK